MPPKQRTGGSAKVYIVHSKSGIDSVYATLKGAHDRVAAAEEEDNGAHFNISTKGLTGGTINLAETDAKSTSGAKATAKASTSIKKEEEDEDEDNGASSAAPVKKTKTPAQQRAANADKPGKPADADLPDNVKKLLREGGKAFEGMTLVVTGVPPTLGRKYTERLVEAFGAHLTKSLSKNTDYVVVGNDAGPVKLEKIANLGIKTLDEDDLISLLENSNSTHKRPAAADEDEAESKPKAKSKKQKK